MSSDSGIISFVGIKVKQPIGNFFVGKIDGKILSKDASAEVRNMKEDDIDRRIGIQRELKASRVKEIKEYVKTSDACFPNSVILSVKQKYIESIKEIDPDIYEIKLKESDETFQIIDGQHRIAGLENYNEEEKFEINVSLFLDMDVEQQAILFSTINSKQKGVDKNLMMDLYTMQTTRNQIKSAHYIARILNGKVDGALNGRITAFYEAPSIGGYKITQANFIDKDVKYISGNEIQQIKDRDRLKNREPLVYADEKIRKKLIFRNMFIDEQEGKIALLINNYFNAIRKRWPHAWNDNGYVLGRAIGFNSLMAILPQIVERINVYDEDISEEEFCKILSKIKLRDDDFSEERFNLNGYGQSDIIRTLRERLENDIF